MSNETITTWTQYTDAGWQHYLPTCMQRRRLRAGDIIMRGYDTADAREADEVNRACRALGIETEIDYRGHLVRV